MWQLWLGVSVLTLLHTSHAEPQQCDVSKGAAEVCDDFCNYRCSFFNMSLGEDGGVKNLTLYRMTPKNATGIRNKDTGDAHGDVTFFLSKKNLTQLCAQHPTQFGCFLDGDNLYGEFVVEISTEYGPYFECNPMNHGGPTPFMPDWVDTQNFYCGQGCLLPTPDGCFMPANPPRRAKPFNGSLWGPMECWCDTTKRHEKTVGRSLNPISSSHKDPVGPSWWPKVCNLGYMAPGYHHPHCLDGAKYRKVEGWSFESTAAAACDACDGDSECLGWATYDNETAYLLKGDIQVKAGKCIAGVKKPDPSRAWGGAGEVGGYWYSTTTKAECPPGAPIGTNGCSWRMVSSIYKNASCIDELVDKKVEDHGQACFSTCPQPLNLTSDCYQNCYRNTLLGDPSYNITAMTDAQVVGPWAHGFREDDPAKGGCPLVTPDPCLGPQCPEPAVVHDLSILV